jgi:peptidoglycan/LPS O-acetylase OafA/YrhL
VSVALIAFALAFATSVVLYRLVELPAARLLRPTRRNLTA